MLISDDEGGKRRRSVQHSSSSILHGNIKRRDVAFHLHFASALDMVQERSPGTSAGCSRANASSSAVL
jgi:hypothetical protein